MRRSDPARSGPGRDLLRVRIACTHISLARLRDQPCLQPARSWMANALCDEGGGYPQEHSVLPARSKDRYPCPAAEDKSRNEVRKIPVLQQWCMGSGVRQSTGNIQPWWHTQPGAGQGRLLGESVCVPDTLLRNLWHTLFWQGEATGTTVIAV